MLIGVSPSTGTEPGSLLAAGIDGSLPPISGTQVTVPSAPWRNSQSTLLVGAGSDPQLPTTTALSTSAEK
jgi:hypothetical protein